jgi:uncharacterized membrane protein YphA (DoxX/SURF4 family)
MDVTNNVPAQLQPTLTPLPGKGHKLIDFLEGRFNALFALDLRSLAMMRMGVALVIIIDLVVRATSLEAHYSNTGVLPLEALFRYAWNPNYVSLYTMAGSWQLQAIVFLANGVCALCLMAGYRTRLFTFICWVFILSLHNRNPLIQQGGDDLLRLLLFWGLFLPWGYYYSVDAEKFSKKGLPSNRYVSLAGFAYVCQIFYVYFFSALLKSSAEWNQDYTALYYALSLDQLVTPFGKLLLGLGDGLKVMTFFAYYTELILPFLLLVPFFTAYFRLAFVIIICLFHIGISMTLYVGLFPLINIVSVAALIPTLVQNRLHSRHEHLYESFKIYIRQQKSRFIDWKQLHTYSLLSGEETSSLRNYVPKERVLTSLIITFFIGYTLLWNLGNLRLPVPLLGKARWVGHLFRVDQYWGMFAPAVFKDDGWFVMLGNTVNGQEVDIKNPGKPVSFDKPAVVADFFQDDRWRKYHENILFVNNNHYRLYYCAYLTNEWNRRQSDPGNHIPHLQIVYMKEVTQPDYQVLTPVKEVLFDCNTVLP